MAITPPDPLQIPGYNEAKEQFNEIWPTLQRQFPDLAITAAWNCFVNGWARAKSHSIAKLLAAGEEFRAGINTTMPRKKT